MTTYSQKLKDPRWQKRRLKILERDNWACQTCGDTEETLHVHHLWYEDGEPWDSPDEALQTLCASCHETDSIERAESEKTLLDVLRRAGLDGGDVHALACAFQYLRLPCDVDMCLFIFGIEIFAGTKGSRQAFIEASKAVREARLKVARLRRS